MCPVEVLCQGACVLHHEGQQPIAVAALQRYATDEARERACRSAVGAARTAGASPLSAPDLRGSPAPASLRRAGSTSVVFDEHDEVGGIVRTAIAPYRQLVDPLPAEREALEELGVRFRLGVKIRSRGHLAAR